jgi:choline dehydrogenase
MTRLPDSADVVIVGGGTCGCVLAARLSEHPGRSVILLEAGPTYASHDRCPPELLDATALPIGPDSRWVRHYDVELTEGRAGQAVRGLVLGGSSAVNGCAFARARPDDFAAWPGERWSYPNVLQYFRALENDHDFGGEFHGASGPMPVRRAFGDDLAPISAEFVDGCLRAGFAEDPDKNAPTSEGVGPIPMNIDGGTRVSTALAYLMPALDRPNLTVIGETTVRRIVFDGDVAVAVDVVGADGEHRTHSGRIILCAGAIESPLLLLRSGVGSPEELRATGVVVQHSLPGVGAGFFDHPEVVLPYQPIEAFEPSRAAPPLQAVLNDGDIEIRPYTTSFGGQRYLGVSLMRSSARGIVRLPASIRFNYLDTAKDLAAMRSGVDTATELLRRLAEKGVVGEFEVEPTDDWLLAHLGTSQHLTGTCRMGLPDDNAAVVDEECNVIGRSGLAVVDASIVPGPISRGVHATAVMIAERAAALLA